MPSSDYSNAVGGGLKLKGAKDGGVDKRKKKKKLKVEKALDSVGNEQNAAQKALADEEEKNQTEENREVKRREINDFGKTEAQRRHEERRKQRLDERLKREGVKTHKERVEELNKYLSGLSEHHDMPRIGPG